MSDPGVSGNATSCLVAGIIYNNEGDHVAALKACHTGLSLEMCVLASGNCATFTEDALLPHTIPHILQLQGRYNMTCT